MVGSTVEEAIDDDEGSARAQVRYEVVGTVSCPSAVPCAAVSEVVTAANADEMLVALMQCDIIVYDITGDEQQVENCLIACNGGYCMKLYSTGV